MSGFPVRRLVPEDAEAASRTVIASIKHLCAADHLGDPGLIAAWTANKSPEALATWIADPGCATVGAFDGAACAGVGAAAPARGEILLAYVNPDHRGRGVTRSLLAALEDILIAAGHTEARLESSATARAFYHAEGWQETGPPAESYGMPGWPMRKALT
ncbi:MAG: GNAT family N-acetyltransferase [Pseudomonadota bacterium]